MRKHRVAISEELEQSFCRKANFGGKWRMTVYGFLQFVDMCFSSLDIDFFLRSGLKGIRLFQSVRFLKILNMKNLF